MERIRFGVIGLSRIAKKSALPALAASSCAKILMLGSRDPEKARSVASTFSAPSFGSYDDIIANPDIDAVYISLPNSLHEEWAVKAAKASKHVWCEKPAALSFASAQKMTAAARASGARMMEGFAFLFHPQHEAVRSLIDEGVLGELLSVEGAFFYPMPEKGNIRLDPSLGGGSYADAAVYPIRTSRMIFRAEPLSVACTLTMDPKTGVDVKADITLTYPEGRTAHISTGFDENYRSTYDIIGSEARLSTERAYAVPPDKEVHLYLQNTGSNKEFAIPPVDQFALMIDDFCAQITLGTGSTASYEDDLLAQARIVEAGLRSNAERRVVQLSEIY